MSKISIPGLIENIKSRTSAYSPIIEAIVNSIQAIEESRNEDGRVIVTLERGIQGKLKIDDSVPAVTKIEIWDNGIGFTKTHRDSFDTVYSRLKVNQGGKGFGRFTFLKHFKEVKIESIYKESNGTFSQRKFNFGVGEEIIENETIINNLRTEESETSVFLIGMKNDLINKKLETISRVLLENLLIFFVIDNFKCPTIIIKEKDGEEIILNDYLLEDDKIQEVNTEDFSLRSEKEDRSEEIEKFQVKIFKVFFSTKKNSIILAANNRQVTINQLDDYIPEFKGGLYEESKNDKGETVRRNYAIKSYVTGKYLNDNVSQERGGFEFSLNDNLYFSFSRKDIERKAAEVTKNIFGKEVSLRREKIKKLVRKYVNTSAPWNKSYLNKIDLSQIPYNATDELIELEFQKHKLKNESSARKKLEKMTKKKKISAKEIEELASQISDAKKNDLVRYVCNRKLILTLFKTTLERDDVGSAEYEKAVHEIIHPMNSDSEETEYEEHNLWILDERLVFSEYISSDKPHSKQASKERPDIAIFNIRRSYRGEGGNNISNPITIFEFKRPKRTTYSSDEDPIIQVGKYLENIRAGKHEVPKGVEKIKANENTPSYGYVIADITEKIHYFAKNHSLTISPDGEGYFGFHPGYNMYVEIISFSKLLKDANLRNKIFFNKLGIDN